MKFISQYNILLLSLGIIIPVVYCGDITINYSPPSLRFGSVDSLRISDIDDILASALGYTPNKPPYGLTVTSPFNYPSAAVIFVVRDAGVSFRMEGTTYNLKENIPITDVYEMLTSLIGIRARRAVHFEMLKALDLVNKYDDATSIPKTKNMDEKNPLVLQFLQEMSALPSLADYLETVSSKLDEGQDVIFIEINTFSPLVKEFGENSDQVKEASEVVRSSLVQAFDGIRKFYDDKLVIGTVKVGQEKTLRRERRQATTPIFGAEANDTDHNLAPDYGEDYPVIFNIIVILSLILIIAIIATSVSMAFMDPGRDSIIYRMTNPRMKKDQ